MIPILVLAYHFPPVGGGGVQRNAKFVRYLPSLGYSPIVVTGSGNARTRWTPLDDTLLRDIPHDVPVHRVPGVEPLPWAGWRGALERRLMLRSPFVRWWQKGAVNVGAAAGRDARLLYASLAPYESAKPASRLARLLGIPWVADLQDPWALDEISLYATSLHRSLDAARMRRLLGTASAIVMNTPEAAKRLVRAFPELDRKLVVLITNGFDASDFETRPSERDPARFRIVHTGYLYTADGLRLQQVRTARRLLGGTLHSIDILTRSHVFLLEAIESLVRREPTLNGAIEVVLAGVLSDVDREIAGKYDFVRMPGYVTHEESIALISSADLLFLPMHDLPQGTRAGVIPGKTYEYLASGRPILAAVPDGDARDLLTEAGGAFVCRPADTTAMADVIASEVARHRKGQPASSRRIDVVARYERRQLTQQLAETFDDVLGIRSARSVSAGAGSVSV